MKYRPEIDGVRAVAVLIVVLYHSGLRIGGHSLFEGGFLGVDVFFVISGFLITNIIQKAVEKNHFSFTDFYYRRARRILPTLFTVMLASLPFAWLYMKPKAIIEFVNSILSSLFFSSNINFLMEDSYTAESSFLKPFLHTWSLSLEEQFYLFFPVILILVHKFLRTRLIGALATASLLSFAVAVYSSVHYPDASFFLIHTRSWELLAGSILAVVGARGFGISSHLKSWEKIMPSLGLVLILGSSVMFTDKMDHPSFLTLLPVIGTCLIIFFAGRGDPATRLLSSKPFVGLGLISYSFYLWHAPVFVFDRIANGESSTLKTLILILLSVFLSILTYYLVEQPFRKKTKVSRWLFVATNLSAFFVLVGFSLFILIQRGAPTRLGFLGEVLQKSMRSPLKKHFRNCSNRDVDSACVFKIENSTGDLISIGDSHGAAIAKQLYNYSVFKHLNFEEFTRSNCPYVPGSYQFSNGRLDQECVERQEQVREHLLSQKPSTVIYNAKMNMYWQGLALTDEGKIDNSRRDGILLAVSDQPKVDVHAAQALVRRALEELLEYGHKVVLVYPVPEPGFFVLDRIKKELLDLDQADQKNKMKELSLSFDLDRHKKRSLLTVQVYDSIEDNENLFRVYPEQILCSEESGRCQTHSPLAAYYYDDNHLSPGVAEILVEKIAEALEGE